MEGFVSPPDSINEVNLWQTLPGQCSFIIFSSVSGSITANNFSFSITLQASLTSRCISGITLSMESLFTELTHAH